MEDVFAPSSSVGINRDGLVTFIAETRVEIKHLTAAVKELAASVQEAVLRFETDADELRDSLGGLVALRNGHGDLGRRISDTEEKSVALSARTTDLETWRTTVKAWIAATAFIASLLGMLVGHFIK